MLEELKKKDRHTHTVLVDLVQAFWKATWNFQSAKNARALQPREHIASRITQRVQRDKARSSRKTITGSSHHISSEAGARMWPLRM